MSVRTFVHIAGCATHLALSVGGYDEPRRGGGASRGVGQCQLPTDEPVLVAIEHSGSVARATVYACPAHARDYSRDTVAQAAARRRAREFGRFR
ncbi:hypothetical protein GCM10009548_68320 [Streptomyces malaysiensis subsp. malaysiensis]